MNKRRLFLYSWCSIISLLAFTCARDYPATAPYVPPAQPTNPGSLPPQVQPAPAQKRLFLANDKVRVGIDLNMGGAINYLAEAGTSVNMINNYDLGRQLQTSLYAGPFPYSINGKDPVYQWRNLGWNPVQTGDYFNNPAQVVSYQQDQNRLYVKTVPLIWPLLNEPADCVMEHWLELKDNTIHVRSRTTVNRRDTTQYEARTQETPCVYVNSPWYRILTYTGTQPFTNGALSEYTNTDMTTRYATENWIALLNSSGRGVGLYKSSEYRYRSFSSNPPHTGGEFDIPSAYINSDSFILIDHNGVYEFEYTLILGTVSDIRQFVYAQQRPSAGPNFRFTQDRQGWYYFNARDTGWPINNELSIKWQRVDTTKSDFRVASPMVHWRAADVPTIYLQGAFSTKATSIRMIWRKPDESDFFGVPGRYIDIPIIGDGQYRTYTVNMAGLPGWDGVVTQLSLNAPPDQTQFEKGSIARIRSITVTKP